jgi:pimeloyl-ACP methyl ester carboxylesterase
MTEDKTFVQLKNGRTHYLLEGDLNNKDAPLIVLVHGIGSGVFSFDVLASFLVQNGGFRLLRFDLYGRGLSDSPVHPQNAELFVEQLHELLQKLNLEQEKVTLIGHSMGGAISAMYTYHHPQNVEKLVVLTPAGLPWKLPFGSTFLKVPYLGRWGFSMLSNWVGAEKAIADNFFDLTYSKESMDFAIKRRNEVGSDKFVDAMVNSVNNFPLTGCAKEITEISQQDRPTFIVWAQYDTTTPSDECFSQWHNLFKENPKADFAVIRDTRHNFFQEEKELTGKLILAWLQGNDHKIMELHKLRNKNSSNVALTARDQVLKAYWDDHPEYEQFMI